MKARQDPEIALKYYPKSVPLSPDARFRGVILSGDSVEF